MKGTLLALFALGATLSSSSMYTQLVDRFIFFPEVLPPTYRFAFDAPFEEATWDRPDGGQVHALYFSPPKGVPPARHIVYFHGNAGSLRTWGDIGAAWTAQGHRVLMVDFRGYGKSTGARSEAALYGDAEAAYQWLVERAVAEGSGESNIVVYGRSLGSAMASYVGGRHKARRVVLETPFVDLPDVAGVHFPFLPVSWLLPYRFDNAAHLRHASAPVTIFHGTADEVVPYASGQKLHEALRLKKRSVQFITIREGRHNTLSNHAVFRAAQQRALTE